MPYSHASMLLLGERSEATEPYNKYDKIRPHCFRSLQLDQKVRPLSFRPEKLDLFTATHREAIVVGAGLCDGEDERAYIAYVTHYIFAFRTHIRS